MAFSAKKIFKIIFFVVLFFLVTAYIVYAIITMRQGNPEEICQSVEITINDEKNSPFVTEQQVAKLLQDNDAYPQGMRMQTVDTKHIEDILLTNNLVTEVNCYKAGNPKVYNEGKICIKMTLRQPVIFVLPEGKNGYYVDSLGVKIPNTAYTQNILTATGQIDSVYACTKLADFGTYVYENPYWDHLIEQVYVSRDAKKRPVVTLVPRLGEQTIYLGPIDGYEKKLARLKRFYDQAMPKVGWNKYKAINLEFNNQIVCTQ